MPGEIEKYAVQHKKLHPAVIGAMSPFLKEYNWNPERAIVKMISPFWGKLSGRGQPTAAFVFGRTIYMMRGSLNAEGLVRGNTFDLSLPAGFATVIHEVFHVYQSERDNFIRRMMSYISGIWKSIVYSKKLYDHKFFPDELEATNFQRKVATTVNVEDLKQFADMR